MKKILCLCLAGLLCLFCLASCDGKNGSEDISTTVKIEMPDVNSDPLTGPILVLDSYRDDGAYTFDYILQKVNASKPTKCVNNVSTYNPDTVRTLISSETYTIANVGGEDMVRLAYIYQSIEEIKVENGQIISAGGIVTTQGIEYSKLSEVGGNAFVLTPSGYNLTREAFTGYHIQYFETSRTINFRGTLKADQVEKVLGVDYSKDVIAAQVEFVISADTGLLSTMTVTLKFPADVDKVGQEAIHYTADYSYDAQSFVVE